jgi:hypothetical protein
MADGPLRRLFWRLAGAGDYFPDAGDVAGILYALAGPPPEAPADQQRERDRERIVRTFPKLNGEEPGAAVSDRADHARSD